MIKTIGDLKQLINDMDNDFEIEMNIMTHLSKEDLIKSCYPYPWISETGLLEFHDVGYSDKVVCFGIYKKDEYESEFYEEKI